MSELPLQGKKILLRGFNPELMAQAGQFLSQHGYQTTSISSQAEAVILGPESAPSAEAAAKKRNIPVHVWTDFKSVVLLAESGAGVPLNELPRLPALEIRDDSVRVLDITMPRQTGRHPFVPSGERFRHLCFDGPLLRNARAAALGASLGLPVALEGETAASKTTAVLWLAHLANQPVVRLNLNGQSDTSELVGRYVPGGGFEGWDVESLHQHADLLEEETQRILARIRVSNRPLSWAEQVALAANEKIPALAWRFQEGFIPQAMREGWWVLLDEINLAEPQVLERLNPVLEIPPTLVLTEERGTVFGPGGQVPVSEQFRLFASMNPAEYAGRSVLSPAFRDRWAIWHQSEIPGEAEYLAMLRCAVFGEQPDVVFEGVCYQSPPTKPVHPDLAEIGGITQILERLAMFHASLAQASGTGGAAPTLGRLRRERYVFTRRTLLTCLQLLSRWRRVMPQESPEHQLRHVLDAAYLSRIRDGSDRNAALALVRAAGLSPE